MRKTKKLLCIVLVLALAVSLFAFPASADNSVSEADYPFVFCPRTYGLGRKIGS